MDSYGKELILDLHSCDTRTFNRRLLHLYFIRLCKLIDMERCEMHFWDDLDTPENKKQRSSQTVGTSAIQFILTSNITIHTLDLLEKVFVNIFSCKDFDDQIAANFTQKWFDGQIVNQKVVKRL